MGRFKKEGNKGTPDLNMGSMSDIIFMFLFFFMVITTMRESSLFVTIQLPKATEVQKLQKKSLVVNINIGAPKDVAKLGNEPRIQWDDQFANVEDIPQCVEREKTNHPENDRNKLTWSLKVNKETKMGIVTDVKQELRKSNAFKVNYSTLKTNK
ncbi:MAG: biopolymer transporter ExbD [Bacteroidales bacterium]|nr:biopolymer transporter ExbD [Bacteroidales bacterium]